MVKGVCVAVRSGSVAMTVFLRAENTCSLQNEGLEGDRHLVIKTSFVDVIYFLVLKCGGAKG